MTRDSQLSEAIDETLGLVDKVPTNSVERRVSAAIDAVEQAVASDESAAEPATKLRLCMVTPWKQECGNAEYAERLVHALAPFADVAPVNLRNFADETDLRSRSSIRAHFKEVHAKIEATAADVVHIQHEFCFFGRSVHRSNREFKRFVERVKKPLVVSIHTWLDDSQAIRIRKKIAKPADGAKVEAVPPTKKKKRRKLGGLWKLFRFTNRGRVLYRALRQCDGIVVHTHDTYSMLVSAYPRLKSKIRICHIPIATVESESLVPAIVKEGGTRWLVLPGFVSPYKGHSFAIQALKLMPPEYRLVIAGGRHPKARDATRYWMELLAEVETEGLESRVIFTGFLPTGAEQSAILKQADAFVLPYDEVGQSGSAVLADALAHSKPVVTSRARSMYAYRMCQDTVYSSISTEVDEAELFAKVIEEACDSYGTGGQSERHRSSAQSRYSLESVGKVYQQLYKDVRSKQK